MTTITDLSVTSSRDYGVDILDWDDAAIDRENEIADFKRDMEDNKGENLHRKNIRKDC